jgi:thiamine biosynthesis protein ThiS
VEVIVNDKDIEIDDGATVGDLIEQLGFGRKVRIVERNGEPIPRGDVATTVLRDGDKLELVRAVAGG